MSASIVCTDLSFEWPDGTPVFDRLNAAFDHGRTGLVGLNGTGKSTLLRIITGRLTPAAGTVSVAGDVGYLAQDTPLDDDRTVSDLLGIAERRAALRAVESGDASAANLAAVGDDWDIEERARAQLHRFGVTPAGTGADVRDDVRDDVLDRTVGTLSGGETVLTALAGLILRRPAVTLLDEPTNNLDRRSRERLYDAVEGWRGVLLVVSHDRELLDRVDAIAELRDGGVRTFGGNFTAYVDQLAAEQEAAERMVRAAESEVRREKRQLIEARTKLDRRVRYGNKMYDTKREPRAVMKERKRQAQVSAGKHRIEQTRKLEEARSTLAEAEEAVRDDDRIRIDLPDTEVPAGRTVLELEHPGGAVGIRGPERVAVLGRNGAGKTTLFRSIVGEVEHPRVTVTRGVRRVAYLPQRLTVLDDDRSVLDNVRAAAPSATPHDVRAGLARFLIRGDRVEQPARVLSGGERFRVALARLLLADEPPQLLILDEPTNNLDLHSVDQLTSALAEYRGALLVASHDLPFLRDAGITRWWTVHPDTGPSETDPPE